MSRHRLLVLSLFTCALILGSCSAPPPPPSTEEGNQRSTVPVTNVNQVIPVDDSRVMQEE